MAKQKIEGWMWVVGGLAAVGLLGYTLLHTCGQGRCGVIGEKVDEWLYGNQAPHLQEPPV